MSLLVFLHALGQTPTSWQPQVTDLPKGMQAVAPWLRGLHPARQDEEFDLTKGAEDVLGQLNVYGVDEMMLCGVNFGGNVALAAAALAPEKVSHLVLVGTRIHRGKLKSLGRQALMAAMPGRLWAMQGAEKGQLLRAIKATSPIDQRALLPLVQAKTLVLVGENDRDRRAAAGEIAAGIKGAQIEIVRGAGHHANEDAPRAFNKLLYDFLAS